MDEKRLVEVMEPFADELVLLGKRIDEIKVQKGETGEPGAPGKDADPVEVADILKKDPTFTSSLKGEPGQDGVSGKDGVPGRDADPAEVAEKVKADAAFIASLRGAPGENGADGIGIKSISVSEDRKSFSLLLDNDQEVTVEMPLPEKGERGEKGLDGLGLETKSWQPGVYREGTYVTHNIGQVFKAVRDTASSPGDADWERVGKSGFRWTGLKHADREYQDGDLYIDGGSTFLWWNGKGSMFSQRGATGKPGEKGADGKDGADAPVIVAVKFYENEVSLVMSNGEIINSDIEDIKNLWRSEYNKSVLEVLDSRQAERMQRGAPLSEFRGYWTASTDYAVGDVVINSGATWVCVRPPTLGLFDADSWTKIASLGGGGGAVTLRGLADVRTNDTPSLGSVPSWSYVNTQTASQGHWEWAKPTAHIKPWDGTTHWEGGATVIHHGQLWRAIFENTNVEPVMEDGKATLYMHIPGKPTFGLVPMGVSSAPPPSGFVDRPPSSWAFWLQYTDDQHMAIWEFVIKGKNPTTGKITGEWEGRPWMVLAHRGFDPPPEKTPPGIVIVWLYGPVTSTKPAVVGQQKWALVDLRSSLGLMNDVSAIAPKDGDILVYSATEHKWKATSGSAWYLAMKAANP